ncbi:MAG: transposase [Planctomycetales bacterium]
MPDASQWLPKLRTAVEPDGVRILESHLTKSNVWQFYVSTLPPVSPPQIVRSIKGRLQNLIRVSHPSVFRRNFHLCSVGDATAAVVEQYVNSQLGHHRMADPLVQQELRDFQHDFSDVNVTARRLAAHGVYSYALHLVLVHDGRWNVVRRDALSRSRDMVFRVAQVKQHCVSRLAVLCDHLHLVAGIPPIQSPQEVALAYLNNLAFAHGMQALFQSGYYAGTLGTYDTGAIWSSLRPRVGDNECDASNSPDQPRASGAPD